MKVYIVFASVDYEGSDVVSIHTSKNTAEAVKLQLLENGDADTYTVEEWTVQP